MNFNIFNNSTTYIYLDMGEGISGNESIVYDAEIARYLDIPLTVYTNILISHGAYMYQDNNELIFFNRKNAKAAIEELIPFLIMRELTK